MISGNHFSDRWQTNGRDLRRRRTSKLSFSLSHWRLFPRPHLHHDSLHQDGSQSAKGNNQVHQDGSQSAKGNNQVLVRQDASRYWDLDTFLDGLEILLKFQNLLISTWI